MIKSPATSISELIDTDDEYWTVFVGHEPNAPANAITVYDQEGIDTRAHTGEVWENPRIQIRIRGLDYETTYQKMKEIGRFLMFLTPYDDSGHRYQGCVRFGSPYYLGFDEQRRVTWSMNFEVHRSEVSFSS